MWILSCAFAFLQKQNKTLRYWYFDKDCTKFVAPLSRIIILTLHLPLTTWMSFLLMFLPNFPQQHFVTFSSSIALLKLITEYFILFNDDVNLIVPLFCFSDHSFCVLVLYPTIVLTVLNLSCLMISCGILRASCI